MLAAAAPATPGGRCSARARATTARADEPRRAGKVRLETQSGDHGPLDLRFDGTGYAGDLIIVNDGKEPLIVSRLAVRGDAADPRGADRLAQQVGGYRIEVVEPLRRLRVVLEETEGIALDLAWEGSFDAVQELPHMMRSGVTTTLDAQRFAQVGTWEGVISIGRGLYYAGVRLGGWIPFNRYRRKEKSK